jgi:hypothetical protein
MLTTKYRMYKNEEKICVKVGKDVSLVIPEVKKNKILRKDSKYYNLMLILAAAILFKGIYTKCQPTYIETSPGFPHKFGDCRNLKMLF